MRAVLVLAVVACFAVAKGDQLFSDGPQTVGQQRSLLQASSPPTYGPRVKAVATISVFYQVPKGVKIATIGTGQRFFINRVKPTLKKFNAKYPGANLNFSATYKSGRKTLTGKTKAWVTYYFSVDLGPSGASYAAALRSELRSVLRKRGGYVKNIRGNIPKA